MDDIYKADTGALVRDGEVGVWIVDAAAAVRDCWKLLLPEERERARGNRSSVARDEFVAGRGVLRLLLARELGCAPREVRFGVGAQGKLKVEGIEFNLAHSRGVVLIALSRAGAVGIDLEHVDREVEAVEIARGSFHPEEVDWIEREGAEAFFRCWTRKEAVVKADGRGLLLPLNFFSVCYGNDVAGEDLVVFPEKNAGNFGYHLYPIGYYVRNLDLEPGMVAALALTRPRAVVTLCKFDASDEPNREGPLSTLPESASFLHRVTT